MFSVVLSVCLTLVVTVLICILIEDLLCKHIFDPSISNKVIAILDFHRGCTHFTS